MVVCTFPMADGVDFDWHTHDDHQLAWAASGVLTAQRDDRQGVAAIACPLHPRGVPHETLAFGTATLRSAYVRPRAFPLP